MKYSKNKILSIAIAASLSAPMAAWATNGYFGHGIGMKSMGMGGAGIALAQDSLASATNPAAAAKVGDRIDFGLNLFSPDRESVISGTAGGAFDGAYSGNETQYFPIPEFGYNRDLGNGNAFAITVVGRGGMNTDYDKEFMLFSAGSGAKPGVDLAQLYISPTFAMELNNEHSIGVSLNLIYQRFKATGLDGFGVPTSTGYDSSTGYSLGLGWSGNISPTVTLGATYTTKGQMSKFDKYAGLFAEQGDFDIPAVAGIGLAVETTPDVTLAFDISKIFYSDVKAIANPLANFFTGGLGTDNGVGFGWEDMTVYKLGVSWQYQPDLVLRAGWNHGASPIPASETLFNFLAPGVVEDHLTVGATWTLQSGSELTLMAMHAFEKEVKGPGSIPTPVFGGGNADIKMSQNAVGIAYGWDL